jgi:hypothetical protein
VHRLHGAGHARADIDALHGFEPAGELVPGGDLGLDATVATDTGVACGAAGAPVASALKLCMPSTAAATASTAVRPVTAGHSALGAVEDSFFSLFDMMFRPSR